MDRHLEYFDEKEAERIAHIIGPSSACARALNDLRDRRAKGERVSLYRDLADNCVVVGPTPPQDPTDQ